MRFDNMNRRHFLATVAATAPLVGPAEPGGYAASPQSPGGTGSTLSPGLARQPTPRTAMGVNLYSFASRHPRSALEFLEYCHSLGAGGLQTELESFEAVYINRLARRSEELGMYLEIISGLPGADAGKFELTLKAAKQAGALCLRSACLSGRRYETFASLEDWKKFVADSKAKIARALPVLEKYRMPMGIENHKDWTAEEQVVLLREHSSEYLGVCLDTGNNIALLDDPYESIELLAPYAVCTHIKDMAVNECADG